MGYREWKIWYAKEDLRLEELLNKGYKAKEIAPILNAEFKNNRTQNAIYDRIYNLGLKPRSAWSDNNKFKALQYWAMGYTYTEIASIMYETYTRVSILIRHERRKINAR